MLAVDRDVVRLHRGIGQRDYRRLERLGVDLGPRRPVRVAHPQEVGVLVGAHAPRTLRPRQRNVEAEIAHRFVEGAVIAEQAIDLDVGHLDLDRLAGGDVALVDSVHRHLRPPAVAVAIPGRAVSCARASRIFLGNARLELGERLGHRIEAHGAAGRRRPDHALAVHVYGDCPAHRSHAFGRLVDRDLLGRGVELAERAAARVDVEPEVARAVARKPVRSGGEALGRIGLQVLDRACHRVDLADRHAAVGVIAGEVDGAVEAERTVVRQLTHFRSGAERPVGAVVRVVPGADARIGIER